MSDEALLDVSRLVVRYGPKVAVSDVSIRVDRGEVVTLLGANGAGKTTTLMALSGFRTVAAGTMTYEGDSLAGMSPAKIARLGVIHVPEGRRVLPGMTVRENLELGAACARYGGREPGDLDRVLERFPALVQKVGIRAGLLSGGEQQMLVIGRALMAAPRLLLLDEPSLGLAPIMIQAVFAVLRDIKQEGVTMLLVEQNVREGLGLADRAYVLENGQIVKHGTGEALLGDDQIQAAYLGGGAE
jgi:branched-chain amino acid transport system ATP-binding protein